MWIIRPKCQKCVNEHDVYCSEDGYTVTVVTYWRKAEIHFDSMFPPQIRLYNPDGIDILKHFSTEYSNGKLNYDLTDSYGSHLEFSDEITSDMRDSIQEEWDDNGELEDGWDIVETGVILYDELTISSE